MIHKEVIDPGHINAANNRGNLLHGTDQFHDCFYCLK